MMQPPFYTLMEMVRLICNAFDIGRSIKKDLDNKAQDRYTSLPEAMGYFEQPDLKKELTWIFGSEEIVSSIIIQIEIGLKQYIRIIKETNGNGISRPNMMLIVFRVFAYFLVTVKLNSRISKYRVSILDEKTELCSRALPVLLERLEKESLTWQSMLINESKDVRDKVSGWKKGEHLPELSSIKLLMNEQGMVDERSAIVLARAWDYLIREYEQTDCSPSDWLPESRMEFYNQLIKSTAIGKESFEPHVKLVKGFLKHSNTTAEQANSAVENMRDIVKENSNPYFNDMYCDWNQARIFIKQEKYKEALDLYKSAIDKSMYWNCLQIDDLLHEALLAASAIGKDRTFCKKIRKSQITFGSALPYQDTKFDSTKYNDHIQDWEIDRYEEEFHRIHKPQNLTPPKSKKGPLTFLFDDVNGVRYDYKKPDKMIKVPCQNGYKRMPQLVYAVTYNHWDQFCRLLDHGANVEKLTTSSESALLMALEKIAFDSIPTGQADVRYFDKLIKFPHSDNTLNTLTEKRRISLLDSAIRSCKPTVVEAVLELGIDIDLVATTDRCTPLYQAIGLLHTLENPQKLHEKIISAPQSYDAMHRNAFQRYANDLFATDEFIKSIGTMYDNEQWKAQALKVLHHVMYERNERISITGLIEIINLLISRGANTNQKHTLPLKDYTPLMLAVEFGFSSIVEQMLKNGGDPTITYYNQNFCKHLNCIDIANLFKNYDLARKLALF
ncbi:MAG: ankyrin repeat domain-containing protein [Oceanobacter sp.]